MKFKKQHFLTMCNKYLDTSSDSISGNDVYEVTKNKVKFPMILCDTFIVSSASGGLQTPY